MPRWKKIHWTGPGSKQDGLHTQAEFLWIVRMEYPERVYIRQRGDPRWIPEGRWKKNDLPKWMAFVGASFV